MSRKNRKNELLGISDLMVTDILGMSDAEIEAEARDQYPDVDIETERLANIVSRSITAANKAKMREAINALETEKGQAANRADTVDIAVARKKVIDFASRDGLGKENILLAARDASTPLESMEDEDILGIYEDM